MIFFVFYIFSNFQEKCLNLAYEIRTSLSTLLPNSHEEMVDDIFFQRRVNVFFYFWTLTKISSDFPRWVIGRVAKTTFCVARWRLFRRKSILERIYFLQSFMIWINYFLKCLWKVLREVVKTAFKVSKRLCWADVSQEVFVIQLLSYFRKVSFENFEDFFLDKNGLIFFRTSS